MPRLNPAQRRLFDRHVERAIEALREGDRLLKGAVADVIGRMETWLREEAALIDQEEARTQTFDVKQVPDAVVPYLEDPFQQALCFNLHCQRTNQSHTQGAKDWEGGAAAVAARNLLFLPPIFHDLWEQGTIDKTRLVAIANRNLTPQGYLEVADMVRTRRREDLDERLLRMPPGSVQLGRRGPEEAMRAAATNGWLARLARVTVPSDLVAEATGQPVGAAGAGASAGGSGSAAEAGAAAMGAANHAPGQGVAAGSGPAGAPEARHHDGSAAAENAATAGAGPSGPGAALAGGDAASARERPAGRGLFGRLPGASTAGTPAAAPAGTGTAAAALAGGTAAGGQAAGRSAERHAEGVRAADDAALQAQRALRAGLSGARLAPEVAQALERSPDPMALVERFLKAHRQSRDPDPAELTKTLFFAHAGVIQKLEADDKLLLRHFRPVKTQKRGQLFYRMLEVIEEALVERQALPELEQRGISEAEAMVAVRKVIVELNKDPNRFLEVPQEWLGELTRRHLYFGSRTRKEGAAYKWFRRIGPRFYLGSHKTADELEERAARRAAKRQAGLAVAEEEE